jgi:hypothetical protein
MKLMRVVSCVELVFDFSHSIEYNFGHLQRTGGAWGAGAGAGAGGEKRHTCATIARVSVRLPISLKADPVAECIIGFWETIVLGTAVIAKSSRNNVGFGWSCVCW